MKRFPAIFSLIVIFFLSTSPQLQAQRSNGDVGIGLQLGQPSGLSVSVHRTSGLSPDILAAWDLNDFFFVNVHGIAHQHLGNSGDFHFIYGPGAFVGIKDIGRDEDRIRAGISGTAGFSVMISSLELYARVTPRLQLLDKTAVDIGGGLGIRLFL